MEKQLNQKSLTVGVLAILSAVFTTAWCVVAWIFFEDAKSMTDDTRRFFVTGLLIVIAMFAILPMIIFNCVVASRCIGYATEKYKKPTPKAFFVISLVFTGIMYFFVGLATVGVCSDAVKVGGMFSTNGIVFIAVTATSFCLQPVVVALGFSLRKDFAELKKQTATEEPVTEPVITDDQPVVTDEPVTPTDTGDDKKLTVSLVVSVLEFVLCGLIVFYDLFVVNVAYRSTTVISFFFFLNLTFAIIFLLVYLGKIKKPVPGNLVNAFCIVRYVFFGIAVLVNFPKNFTVFVENPLLMFCTLEFAITFVELLAVKEQKKKFHK